MEDIHQIADTKNELTNRITDTKTELTDRMNSIKTDTIIWIVGIGLLQVILGILSKIFL